MKIECVIIKWRYMQVNPSLSPPPVWNMNLCLCNHDGNLLCVYDKYSLIWFAWIRMLLRVWFMCFIPLLLWPCSDICFDCITCLAHDLPTANHHDHAWTETCAQKSVPCTSCSSSSDHGMYIKKASRGATPAGRKVSEQIIQLALPYWMWVSWSSWEGWIGKS